MARINSKEKGKVGERELAKVIAEVTGEEARRGLSQSGGAIEADVVGLDGHWVESKFYKNIAAIRHLDQAKRDASANGGGVIPVACVRENRGPWAAIVDLRIYLALVLETARREGGEGRLVELAQLVEKPSRPVKAKSAKRVPKVILTTKKT